MSGFSGRAVVYGGEAPAEPQGHAPEEYEFARMGGMDLAFSSAVSRRLRRGFLWSLAFGLIALIVLLLFFPFRMRSPLRANELSAILAIRVIQQAELQYKSTYPTLGYTCELPALGGDPSSGPPGPLSAQIIQNDFDLRMGPGYIIRITNCTNDSANGANQITDFKIIAAPQIIGKTGKRGFCASAEGPIRFDPAGGTNCAQEIQ